MVADGNFIATGPSTMAAWVADAQEELDATVKVTGAQTIAGDKTFSNDVTVSGAFASVGIDDNATGERLQIADASVGFGANGSGYVLYHVDPTQIFTIGTASGGGSGANIQLFGNTHAMQADDFVVRTDTTVRARYAAATSDWDFTGATSLTCSAFTSTGIDDNATAERVQIADTQIQIGAGTSATYFISARSDDGAIAFNGSNTTTLGGAIQFFGDMHASLASSIRFLSDNVVKLIYSGANDNWDYNAIDIIDTGNIVVGGSTPPASATASIALVNGTVPTGNVTNGVSLYAEDVSASSELKVRDEAGNVTTLSSHGPQLFAPGAENPMAYCIKHHNVYTASESDPTKCLYQEVDIMGAVAWVQEQSGKQFIYNDFGGDLRNWDDDKKDEAEAYNAAKLERATAERERRIEALCQQDFAIDKDDAIETVATFEEVETNETELRFAVNKETGEVVEIKVPKIRKNDTGRTRRRIKEGIRFDNETGRFFRCYTREEAEAIVGDFEPPEQLKPKQPSAWIADRIKSKRSRKPERT